MLPSKQLKELARRGQPVPFEYETISTEFRGQLTRIWTRLLSGYAHYLSGNVYPYHDRRRVWEWLVQYYGEEIGIPEGARLPVPPDPYRHVSDMNAKQEFEAHLFFTNTEGVIDMIASVFHVVNVLGFPEDEVNSAREMLNRRFREHDLGYDCNEKGVVTRVDSQYIHSESVEPALHLLQVAGFDGPEQEFLNAHEHLRHSRHKEAATDALKAFESTMKAICDARGWTIPTPANASKLIDTMFTNGLVSRSVENEFNGLKMVLTGLATVRNAAAAHGQGATPVEMPEHVAAYALHMAAANIVFLVEAHKNTP